MYIILMDTHKGQTKYSITLNDEDSNIVKITRAKPGTIPGRWHTEEEVKLDSISQDIYGTSKQNIEKMFQEIAESKDSVSEYITNEENDKADEKDSKIEADEKDSKIEADEKDSNIEADEKAYAGLDAKESLTPIDELKNRLASLERKETIVGEGRKTRKNKKRTTRKKHRKGVYSKSNKNNKKHTRGKK